MTMTTISADAVKQLRELTGAGFMDCKRALEETNGDLEAAQKLLRERGIAQAGKRAGRTTTEGIVLVTIGGNVGAMVAVGCETEPVAKNEEFQAPPEPEAGEAEAAPEEPVAEQAEAQEVEA